MTTLNLTTFTLTVEPGSKSDLRVQLLDTTRMDANKSPLVVTSMRMRPGESHRLAVSPGISMCLMDMTPVQERG